MKKKEHLIYVVEDDPPMNTMLCKFLTSEGYTRVKGFFTGEEMLKELRQNEPVIIIEDFDLPGMTGLEVIEKAAPKFPNADFIFLSGQGSIEIAIRAIKLGAFDYIVKDNFAKENVLIKINNLLKIKALNDSRKKSKLLLLLLNIFLFISWLITFLYIFKTIK